tara:strand:- start:316 stop:747 length:432 start_codon:yes stop_codon:yes gene_type:complete
MRKSLLISFAIALSVIGWFLSGQISIGNENSKNESNNQEIIENNDNIPVDNNSLKVETQLIYAEEIVQSVNLQGQTIYNRAIDVKSQTTGNIIKKNFKRGDIVTSNKLLVELSMEDREELLNSYTKDLQRIKKEILIIEKKKE